MRQNADTRLRVRGGTDQFKSPLAHELKIAPDLVFVYRSQGLFSFMGDLWGKRLNKESN